MQLHGLNQRMKMNDIKTRQDNTIPQKKLAAKSANAFFYV